MRRNLIIDGERFLVHRFERKPDRIVATTVKDDWSMVIHTDTKTVFINYRGRRITEWKYKNLVEEAV
jgi:hypothetical protein